MNWAGHAGQAMLALGLSLVLVGTLATLPRGLRARSRALVLRDSVAAGCEELLAALGVGARLRAERGHLVVPIRQMKRWMTHPLLVAIAQSLARRRRR